MRPFFRSRIPAVIALAAILLFSGYCLFYKLGNEPFQDYDEATYALVTHASIEQGEPSGLSFLNAPYFRKPPLLFWMTTASARVFHDIEFADRLPSALAGFLAVALVALICLEAGAGAGTAVIAAGILGTTATWAEFARDVRFDNLVALFCAAAFYAAIRAVRDSRWFVLVGIALALAILSKSAMALFGGIAVLALLVCERKFLSALSDRNLWLGVAAFLLVAAPWHVYMTITYGAAFWHSYLGTEVLERASTNLFPGGNNPTNAQYLGYFIGNAAPWSELFVLAALGIAFLRRQLTGMARSVFLASFATALSVLAVAFVAHTKAFGYLMPLYPFLAVMLALAGRALWQGAGRRWRAALPMSSIFKPALLLILLALFAYGAARTRYEALHIDPYYGWELSQAYEEHDVSLIIRAAPDPVVYAYGGYDAIGSIYFYTGIPDTAHPYINTWSASSAPLASTTTFILATSSLASLSDAFPQYRFVQDYSGTFVSLFTATAAR